MATGIQVTGRQAIKRIRHLIASGDPEGALAYWQDVRPLVWDSLTVDELCLVGELLSGADRMVRYADDEAAEATER